MEPTPSAGPAQKVWQQPWFWMVPFTVLALGVVLLAGRGGFGSVSLSGGPDGIGLELGSAEPDLTTVLDTLLSEHDGNVYRDWTLRQLRERYGLLTIEEMSADEVRSLDAILKPDSARRLQPAILTQLVSEFRLYQADALSERPDHVASFLKWLEDRFKEGASRDETDSARAVRLQQVIDSDRFIAELRDRAATGALPFGSIEQLYRASHLGPPGRTPGGRAPPEPCVWVHRESPHRNAVVEVYNPATGRQLHLFAVSGGFAERGDPVLQLNTIQYEYLSGAPGGPPVSVLVQTGPSIQRVSDISNGDPQPRLSKSAAQNRCVG